MSGGSTQSIPRPIVELAGSVNRTAELAYPASSSIVARSSASASAAATNAAAAKSRATTKAPIASLSRWIMVLSPVAVQEDRDPESRDADDAGNLDQSRPPLSLSGQVHHRLAVNTSRPQWLERSPRALRASRYPLAYDQARPGRLPPRSGPCHRYVWARARRLACGLDSAATGTFPPSSGPALHAERLRSPWYVRAAGGVLHAPWSVGHPASVTERAITLLSLAIRGWTLACRPVRVVVPREPALGWRVIPPDPPPSRRSH